MCFWECGRPETVPPDSDAPCPMLLSPQRIVGHIWVTQGKESCPVGIVVFL